MTDQPLDDDMLDTEGHRFYGGADAETAEGEDTEGHRFFGGADAESAEGDDTEGHMHRNP
jgi:hypothetical protein